jgi:hypothetical protein
VSGLKQLNVLCNLTDLKLRAQQDGSVLDLSRLTAMENLDIGSDLSDRDLATLSGLSHLCNLDIHGDFTGKGLSQLTQLPDLQRLAIAGQTVLDDALAPLAKCTKLHSLYLHGTCTDRCLMALADCRALRLLHIQSNKPFSQQAVTRFRSMRPDVYFVCPNPPKQNTDKADAPTTQARKR